MHSKFKLYSVFNGIIHIILLLNVLLYFNNGWVKMQSTEKTEKNGEWIWILYLLVLVEKLLPHPSFCPTLWLCVGCMRGSIKLEGSRTNVYLFFLIQIAVHSMRWIFHKKILQLSIRTRWHSGNINQLVFITNYAIIHRLHKFPVNNFSQYFLGLFFEKQKPYKGRFVRLSVLPSVLPSVLTSDFQSLCG